MDVSYTIFVLMVLSSCSVAVELPSVPFTSKADAQLWIDDWASALSQYWRGVIEFDDIWEGIADFRNAKAAIDGDKPFNFGKARATANKIRRFSNPDNFEDVTCVVNDETIFDPPTRTLIADCAGTVSLNIPSISGAGARVPVSSKRTFVWDTNGIIIEHNVESDQGVFGQIISYFITANNAQNGDVTLFEFGSFKIDKFDAMILVIFASFTVIIAFVLCVMMKKVNAIYRYLSIDSVKKHKYSKVRADSSTENEMLIN